MLALVEKEIKFFHVNMLPKKTMAKWLRHKSTKRKLHIQTQFPVPFLILVSPPPPTIFSFIFYFTFFSFFIFFPPPPPYPPFSFLLIFSILFPLPPPPLPPSSLFTHKLIFAVSKCYFLVDLFLLLLGNFFRNTSGNVSSSIPGYGWVFFFLLFQAITQGFNDT